MATINYDQYYKVAMHNNTDALTSFEKKIWEAFHVESLSPRLISQRHDCDLNTTIEFINKIINKVLTANTVIEEDKEERIFRRKVRLKEAIKVAEETGSNELLIMSEV